MLAPYCQQPTDCRLLAQAHCQVSLLGRVQKAVADHAPYQARLDVGRMLALGRLEACLEWLLLRRNIAGLHVCGMQHRGREVTLNLRQAELLGRLLAAHGRCASQPITRLGIHTSRLGQQLDAGKPLLLYLEWQWRHMQG